ncbi:methyltransferase domain-containing protein [Candidatus Parvarchaeota archaeon]|nr:methyltransferase domain-containing protein [Candidatus Parvarchaeota archaeon]
MIFPNILRKLKRGPQVILPKDIGMILAYSGVGKTSKAVDAGAGSGWLAISLGNVCKSVVAYEWREDFVKLASENVQRAGLKNVKIKHASVFDGIKEKELDLVTLDLADSDKAVGHAYGALKDGGMLVGYLPHAEQVQRFVKACEGCGQAGASKGTDSGFGDKENGTGASGGSSGGHAAGFGKSGCGFGRIETIECMVREYLVREAGFRPENTGLTHTAYLVFALKVPPPQRN